MDHISQTLDGLLRNNQLRQGIADYQVIARWAVIAGDPLAAWTKPLRVVDDTLWVHVANSTLLHHLAYIAPKLCARIRATCPDSSVRRVRFTIRERES